MSNEEGTKPVEAGMTAEHQEDHTNLGYDYHATCRLVTELSEKLIRETNSAEHRFRPKWTESLMSRYQRTPGRPIVHLSNLVDNCIVNLDSGGREIVRPYWEKLVSLRGGRWAWYNYRGIIDFIGGSTTRIARLWTWNEFAKLTGFDVNRLEPYVKSLQVSDGRYIRTLTEPKLPINLATESGGRLIGYRGDSHYRNAAFTNRIPELHQDYKQVIRDVLGNLSFTETAIVGGFTRKTYLRTNVGYLVSSVLGKAGFENKRAQKQSNDPLPIWMFSCDPLTRGGSLGALWDAEGSVHPHDLKVGQAAICTQDSSEQFPVWPANKAFRGLTCEAQEAVLQSPPMLLVSAALLLMSFNIVSRLMPTKVARVDDVPTGYWHLRVERDESIANFAKHIHLRSHKQDNLDSLYPPNS